jgi:hypothetical protein
MLETAENENSLVPLKYSKTIDDENEYRTSEHKNWCHRHANLNAKGGSIGECEYKPNPKARTQTMEK